MARHAVSDEAHADDGPVVVLRDRDDELAHVLREAQRLLLLHPIAAQAAFGALMAEGRAFAQTPEGALWKARLEGSETVERVATLWENVTLNLLEESAGIVPSRLLDVVVMAAGIAPLDRFLSRLFPVEDAGSEGAT
jgi:hypothetical protein